MDVISSLMLGQCIDNRTSTVDNLSRKLVEGKSCLVVIKTVNNELLKRVTSLETDLLPYTVICRRQESAIYCL